MSDLFPRHPILLVDDEAALLRSYESILRNEGMSNILRCSDSRQVEPILAGVELEVVVLDLSMPHVGGQEILALITGRYPEVPVIVVTAAAELDTAVDCMKHGAFDYMVKPVDHRRLVAGVNRGIELRELRSENAKLKQHMVTQRLEHPDAFSEIVTRQERMMALFLYVESVAPSSRPVFITGETGVGKELFAKAIHALSGRSGRMMSVNVAGLDDSVFADTLFGHLKGAYTGAETARAGLAESAEGGTLFLDEIGDLSMASQVKLLRFLQDGEYLPLGSDRSRRSDARVIVSTNRDVKALVAAGRFREDLYYRLQSHHIHIPPLRERLDDLALLLDHFLDEAANELHKQRPTPARELLLHLQSYHFPGNVRELRAMVHDAVTRHSGRMLSMSSFQAAIERSHEQPTRVLNVPEADQSILFQEQMPTMREATYMIIREALRRTENNQVAAARMLGISRQTLNKYAQEIAGAGVSDDHEFVAE